MIKALILKTNLNFKKPKSYLGSKSMRISIALALSLEPQMDRELFLTVTYVIVVFSIIAQGLTIGTLVKRVLSKNNFS
jgi:hypothetical protein